MKPYYEVKQEFFESLKHLGAKTKRRDGATSESSPVDEDSIALKVAAIIMPSIKLMLEDTLAQLVLSLPKHVSSDLQPGNIGLNPSSPTAWNPTIPDGFEPSYEQPWNTSPVLPAAPSLPTQVAPVPYQRENCQVDVHCSPQIEVQRWRADSLVSVALPEQDSHNPPVKALPLNINSVEYQDQPARAPPPLSIRKARSSSSLSSVGSTGPLLDSALQALRDIRQDPTAEWKSAAQQTAMIHILEHEHDVITIMPTGGGKSMLYEVPARVEAGYTVVLFPLLSLIDDVERKLTASNTSYERYLGRNSRLSGEHSLILSTYDIAKMPGWRKAICELNLQDSSMPVKRIVFDEGHVAFTSEDFRPALRDMFEVRHLPVQFVILSATIPPSAEAYLKMTYGLSQSAIVIRMSTVRPEIQYIMEANPSVTSHTDVTQSTVRVCQANRPQGADRAVVFVPVLDTGKPIVEALRDVGITSVFYNAKLPKVEQDEVMQQWIQGQYHFLITTNAFGTGNDHAHIRTVIHAGSPKEMLGYIQEMGRSGRDGQPSKCIVIRRGTRIPWINPGTVGPDRKGTVAVGAYLFPKRQQCLRYAITLHCDGLGVSCMSSSNMQLCSYCQKLPPHVAAQRPAPKPQTCSVEGGDMQLPVDGTFGYAFHQTRDIMEARAAILSAYIATIRDALTYLDHHCGVCHVTLGDKTKNCKNIHNCPTAQAAKGFIPDYMGWCTTILYDTKGGRAICYYCHVPSIHDTLHTEFVKGSKEGCVLHEAISVVTFSIFNSVKIKAKAEVHFNQTWEQDRKKFTTWLGAKPAAGKTSNMIDLILWYLETHS